MLSLLVVTGGLAAACATAPAPRPEAATATTTPAAPLASAEAAPFVDRSIDLALAGDLDGAYEAARQAIRRDPHGLAAQVAWVEAQLALGRRPEALTAAEQAVDDHPEATAAHYALGRVYAQAGRRDEALTAFETALHLSPDDLASLVALMAAHLQLEDHTDEVEELAELLRERAPGDPYVLHNLAVAADVRGDTPSALELYRQAIAAAPTHPVAHYNLARLLEREYGLEAARADYEAFLREAEPSAERLVATVRKRLEQKP